MSEAPKSVSSNWRPLTGCVNNAAGVKLCELEPVADQRGSVHHGLTDATGPYGPPSQASLARGLAASRWHAGCWCQRRRGVEAIFCMPVRLQQPCLKDPSKRYKILRPRLLARFEPGPTSQTAGALLPLPVKVYLWAHLHCSVKRLPSSTTEKPVHIFSRRAVRAASSISLSQRAEDVLGE